MELRRLTLERYKGYAERIDLELAPLTVLVGPNNAGKSALAQAVQLVAGGLATLGKGTQEPLPLESGGILHGNAFEDLVTGRLVHGRVGVGATFLVGNGELSLHATVQNVLAPDQTSERQIAEWRMTSGDGEIRANRTSLDESAEYRVSVTGKLDQDHLIHWSGLLPTEPRALAGWVASGADVLQDWARGVRYLQCPRTLVPSPFPAGGTVPSDLGVSGRNAPLILAGSDYLRESVRTWYREAFGVSLEIRAQGPYAELVIRGSARDAEVQLAQSGAGLAQVLPVAVAVLTAEGEGPGVDVIEHPEAELHPTAHAAVAELLLSHLPGRKRPVIVETHSEMLLLRARRWIAEGRLSADQVLIYWISKEPGIGSTLKKIRVTDTGDVDRWPENVFVEDYEEILAIRRASRRIQ